MKDFFVIRDYEKNICGFKLGVVYKKKEEVNIMIGKYCVYFKTDDLLTYDELKEKLKKYDYDIELKKNEEILREILENPKLRYDFKIVAKDDDDYFQLNENDYFYDLERIRRFEWNLKLKRLKK